MQHVETIEAKKNKEIIEIEIYTCFKDKTFTKRRM